MTLYYPIIRKKKNKINPNSPKIPRKRPQKTSVFTIINCQFFLELIVVLFGSEYVDFYVYQQNPAFGYQRYEAQVSGSKTGTSIFLVSVAKTKSMFFIQPLPRGSEIKIYGYRNAGAYNDTITYCGIQGVDFVLTKPGLMYYEKNDPEHKNEYESLKSMLPYFKGTDWEPVITERMEELSNESKKK